MTKFSDLPTKVTVDPGDYLAIDDVSTNTSKKITQATLAASLVNATSGWNNLGYAPNTVVCNGNRSYTLTFNSVDLTAIVTNSMRLRTTRTVSAPVQSTLLNGSTQFYSKSSPAGMAFTDDFVISAWIKMTAYNGTIQSVGSRYNGTSGFDFQVNTNGQLIIAGYNGSSGNVSYIISNQSIPISKWIHVTGQLDMSSFTNTATTSYLMLDGVDVAASVARGGTAPTALVQAGNFEIGSRNAGTQPFNGKIAQFAIYNAKVTQANIRATISQSVLGTETSLTSGYTFSGSVADLNTTSANNLTANGSAVATNADSSFGGQANGTISSTLDHGIIQSVSFSTNTTMVVQMAEGCTIPTSGGVSSVSYATVKSPFGFPGDHEKWRIVTILFAAVANTGGGANTVYTAGNTNLNVPIGGWSMRADLSYDATPNSTTIQNYTGLSTSTSSFSDNDLIELYFQTAVGAGSVHINQCHQLKNVTLASMTPYYAVCLSGVALNSVSNLRGSVNAIAKEYSLISAENAYL
jgi:hypothetical protein